MSEIHAFDPDGTPSPGAQTALNAATAPLASKDDLAEAADHLADEMESKVDGGDPRLSDARPPLAHTHTASQVSDFGTAVASATSALPTKAYVDGAVQSIATSGIAGVSPSEVRTALGASVVVGGTEPADAGTPVLWINTRGAAFLNPTYPTRGYPIAADAFSRPDGALGSTEWGAKTWTNTGGAFAISGGRAKYASGDADVYATVEAGALDLEVTTQIATLNTDHRAGIMARYSSDTRHVLARTSRGATLGYALAQRYSSTGLSYLGDSTILPKVGDIVTLRVVGSAVQLIVNGTLVVTGATTILDGTKAGMWGNVADTTTAHEYIKVRGA